MKQKARIKLKLDLSKGEFISYDFGEDTDIPMSEVMASGPMAFEVYTDAKDFDRAKKALLDLVGVRLMQVHRHAVRMAWGLAQVNNDIQEMGPILEDQILAVTSCMHQDGSIDTAKLGAILMKIRQGEAQEA